MENYGEKIQFPYHGSAECPLCNRYHCGQGGKDCPIMAKTGDAHCRNTPFVEYGDVSDDVEKVTGKILDTHQAMIDWMQSLYDECEVEEERTYSIGDKFKDEDDNCYYVLSAIDGNKCKMICLAENSFGKGCYYGEGGVPKNTNNITQEEFEKICSCGTFTPVTLTITENKTGK
ncbi:unnamed protein product [marine sediment metagenome]|uniref:Uncharacterized protein n=1 Tax=marine sediment metagenome TaxID=412755 RepID=X0WYW4_9ZZZZ